MRALAERPARPSPLHVRCEPCDAWIVPIRPHWGWRVTEIAFWVSLPAILVVFKAVGFILTPFILLIAGGLAGPLREQAAAEPTCPQCERHLERPTK